MIPTATIKAAIALYDGVTAPLRSMHKAMSVVINSFESMAVASGNAIDVAALQTAREELAQAESHFDAIEDSIRSADAAQNKFNSSLRSGKAGAEGLLSAVKKVAVAAGGITGLTKLINLSDDLTSTNARLNLIVDDGGSVEELEQKIMASAQRSRASYFDTASAIASMGANAGAAFGSNDELIAFMEQVNRQFVIGGATEQGKSAAMLQLTQAMGAGALRGEELNSILENAPGIARAIERYMGVAEGSIKKYAEQGQITAEVVKNALFSAANDTYDEFGNLIEGTNSKFESMPMTWGQIFTNVKNQALSVFTPVLTKINEIANSAEAQQAITGLINGLAGVATIAAGALGIITSIESSVVENWGMIAPIIGGIATAMLLYNGYLLANNILTTVSNVQKGIAAVKAYAVAAGQNAEAASTAKATAAQYGFNAALLSCPLTWVVVAIVAVIAAVYLVVSAINKAKGTAVSATGVIFGAVAWLGAVIGNVVIGCLNGIIQLLWSFIEPCIGVIEWILNVCQGGFDSFGGAVANLIGNIIGWFLSLGQVVTKIIDAVFGTNWTDGLEELKGKVTSWGKNENAITLNREAPDVIKRIDMTDAYDSGYNLGKGLEDKVKGLFSTDDMDKYDIENILDGIYASADDTAVNTAATADALECSEEDLKYLRDLAEREAINRFTTAEVKVDMSGMTNKIDSDVDIDGIFEQFGERFAEAVNMSCEGVYF